MQHHKRIKKEKVEKNKKLTKKSALSELEKQSTSDKNIKLIKKDGSGRLTSSNFFSQLQNTVKVRTKNIK